MTKSVKLEVTFRTKILFTLDITPDEAWWWLNRDTVALEIHETEFEFKVDGLNYSKNFLELDLFL